MRTLFYILIFLSKIGQLDAQVSINVSISPFVETSPTLYFILSENQSIELNRNSQNLYQFAIDDVISGVYRFVYNTDNMTNDFVDVIINGNESLIDFRLEMTNTNERKVVFNNSDENKSYQIYLEQSSLKLTKLRHLSQYYSVAINHPISDNKELEFLNRIKERFETHKKDYFDFRNRIIKDTTQSWTSLMVSFSPTFIPSLDNNIAQEINEYYENYWQVLPEISDDILKTPLAILLIQDYFKFFLTNPKYSNNIEELKSKTNQVLDKFSTTDLTFKFAIHEIQQGLKSMDFTELLKYVDVNYATKVEQCTLESGENDELQKRLRSYEVLKKGAQAPQITFNEGEIKNLEQIPSEYVLLVFHSSQCQHCLNQIPQLYQMFHSVEALKIVSVLLDKDEKVFHAIKQQYPAMLHYSDLEGWEGSIANSYFIRATPTYFLLDKNRTILGSFKNLESVVSKIDELI